MGRWAERIKTQHPDGKEGVNIEVEKYNMIREAILEAVRERGEMPFGELADAVGRRVPDFDGSHWLVHHNGKARSGST